MDGNNETNVAPEAKNDWEGNLWAVLILTHNSGENPNLNNFADFVDREMLIWGGEIAYSD